MNNWYSPDLYYRICVPIREMESQRFSIGLRRFLFHDGDISLPSVYREREREKKNQRRKPSQSASYITSTGIMSLESGAPSPFYSGDAKTTFGL